MSTDRDYPGLDSTRATLAGWLEAAESAGEAAALRTLFAELSAAPSEAPAPTGKLPGRFGLIGSSPAMQQLFSLIERVAPSNVPVLVHGETGSGKELVARALHDYGARSKGPFLAENCAAVTPSLLESELFGHVRGAFTDAVRERRGTFTAADGGTVFLDEIGDMPLEMQAKILRVLQEGEVRPVGSTKSHKVDVRIVAASHRDLAAMAREGSFREDLLFRLNVITLEVPPLRERKEDLPALSTFLLARIADEEQSAPRQLTPAALEALAERRFPGNVRELENLLRRAAALTPPGRLLDTPDLVN